MPEAAERTLRSLQGRTSTLNEAERTVEVIWSTGAPVKRYDYTEGFYMEELAVEPEAIRLDRFVAGMSLLDSHDSYSMDARLGTVVVDSVRIAAGKAYATIKLSRKARGEELLRDLVDGHAVQISVGYKVHRFEKTEGSDGKLPTFRATDWEPLELSAVTIPADAGAFSRTHQEASMPQSEIIERGGEPQSRNATRAERRRVTEIQDLAERGRLDEDFVRQHIEAGSTIDQVRTAVFERIVERQEQSPTFPHAQMHTDRSRGDEIAAREDALFARLTGTAPSERARQFMGDRLEDHARGLLEVGGVNTRGMSREDVFLSGRRGYGAHTTSDFPLLLQGAGRRVLVASYEAAQSPIKSTLARASTAPDFRPTSRLRVSNIGPLKKIHESGEITNTTRGEVAEGYRLEQFGRIFSLSRPALINDDLNAFGDWAVQAGIAAAETENLLLFELLTENEGTGPKMGEDGKRLFHADHGNLAASGTPLDFVNISAARLAMRTLRGVGGQTGINITPQYLLVGPELETQAEMLTAAVAATTTDEVNPFAGKFTVLVEPQIEDKSWYLFASPQRAPVLEYSYLASAPGPQIASQENFRTMDIEMRANLDFGAGALDWRGAYRNPGIN
ncbi:prohead protease/major capsid protein fusion protein [Tianweitania populi]|uniref:Peptidase U35 n=1 Tax=Tianweitania populi TaxID=1607949 RepID=A0A8J3DS82_9HYPH|nr:prohead protease/major capsid protein fusion protein [Tianweitania populi]GHD07682.1 hypothetical protein GCM10016234_06370 [Tianweitania populi]